MIRKKRSSFMKVVFVFCMALLILGGFLIWKKYFCRDVFSGNVRFDKYANALVEPVTFYAKECKDCATSIARKGLLFRQPKARATVLICHGFMCNKTDVRFLRSIFHDYNVMLFDFRAHGESTRGQTCTFGCNEVFDIRGAVDFIKSDKDMGSLPLVVYGFSMGAVSSINAQSQDGSLFDCAIWDCPFDSTEDLLARSIKKLKINLFGHTFPFPGRSFLKKYAYNRYVQAMLKAALKTIAQFDSADIEIHMVPIDTTSAIKKVTIPSFFITCKNDDKAPPEAVQKVYDGAQGFKRYWITNGRRHYDSFLWDPEKYTYKVRKFIENFLNNTYKKQVQAESYKDEPDIFERID